MRQKVWGPDYYAQVVLSQFVRFPGTGGVRVWTDLLNDDFPVAAVNAIVPLANGQFLIGGGFTTRASRA